MSCPARRVTCRSWRAICQYGRAISWHGWATWAWVGEECTRAGGLIARVEETRRSHEAHLRNYPPEARGPRGPDVRGGGEMARVSSRPAEVGGNRQRLPSC